MARVHWCDRLWKSPGPWSRLGLRYEPYPHCLLRYRSGNGYRWPRIYPSQQLWRRQGPRPCWGLPEKFRSALGFRWPVFPLVFWHLFLKMKSCNVWQYCSLSKRDSRRLHHQFLWNINLCSYRRKKLAYLLMHQLWRQVCLVEGEMKPLLIMKNSAPKGGNTLRYWMLCLSGALSWNYFFYFFWNRFPFNSIVLELNSPRDYLRIQVSMWHGEVAGLPL